MKVLTFVLAFVLTASNPFVTQDETVVGTYLGFENDMYVFVDNEENYYEFSSALPAVTDKMDLMAEEVKGKLYQVTYKVETDIDELDEEFDDYIITSLKLLQ
ncbi:hypothetical protein [Croceivirga radicis]|uniref:hypothetical protein n=1 Tax=Croceivirga radicis TaxID=1929488 RepID=UPI000255B8B1|nr:hypothetical protein [Croceivirga radicis]